MTPTVKLALLCDYALTSQEGKLSALGIFSQMNFPMLPNAAPRFFVVIVLVLDAGSHPVRIGIVDPSGQHILPEGPQAVVPVEVAGAETNLVVDFGNVVFSQPGLHQVQLYVSDLLVHTMLLTVQVIGTEEFTPGRGN